MKKCLFLCLMILLAACVLPVLCAAGTAESAGEEAEWTVLFYICGSDLESKYSCATETLNEISLCSQPINYVDRLVEFYGDSTEGIRIERPGNIHVLLATGGAKEWHASEDLNISIRTDCLQYWRFMPDESPSFRLEKEAPLASMSRPETLTEFIRWGTATCPAKKYALVLWGHGSGSKTGVLVDELYDGDTMYLSELHDALADSDVMFESVLFDACMMANMETAWAVHENVRWMTASEEMVSGKGTAVKEWLQQLYYVPSCDGRWLGRWICDMTQVKYANNNDQQARDLMTWSVIDLSRIEHLVNQFDAMIAKLSSYYEKYPIMTAAYGKAVLNSESYGMGEENMHDMAGLLYKDAFRMTAGADIQWEFQEALTDVVDYCVRGNGRPEARGLSFCFPTDFDPEELDGYARNCPCPHYLAFMDAISPWTAPDWVYETVEHLPEMSTLEIYQIKVDKTIFEDGTPALVLTAQDDMKVDAVRYHLYRKNEETGQVICLGLAPAYNDFTTYAEQPCYRIYDLELWPAIDGELCEVDMLNDPRHGTVYDILFNIPVRINTKIWYLRCAFIQEKLAYEVYGLWDGYNANTALFNRNVMPLSQVAGQDYNLLYSVYGGKNASKTVYEAGKTMRMYRSLDVEAIILPPGTYYVDYEVYDVFQRPMRIDRVELNWDGEKWTTKNDGWTGEITLDPMEYYYDY